MSATGCMWRIIARHCLIIHKGRVGEVYNIGGLNEMRNIDIVKLICKALDKPESLIPYCHRSAKATIYVMPLIQPRFTMSWAGYRKPCLKMVFRKPSSGVWTTGNGGRPSSMVSIRITTRRCTGIDNSWEKSVWDESICYRCKWAAWS